MSLVETKIEVDLTSAFKEALNLGKHFDSQYRLKAFRKFINNVDDDYKTFSVAGVDVMPLLEAIILVQAGAPCVQVAKLVVRGALEASNPNDQVDEHAKQIWYALTDLTFQFCALAITPAELAVIATVRDGAALCRGPFVGVNRAGSLADIPKDLINEGLLAVLDEKPTAAMSWTSSEVDGKEWVPCEGFDEHPHRQAILDWYARTHGDGKEFVDLSVFIEMCRHAKGKTEDEHIQIFNQFMHVQRLILNAHDVISFFAGTTSFPESRRVALKAQHRAKPVPITYATADIKGLAREMAKLSVDVLETLPPAIDDYRRVSPPKLSRLAEKAPFEGIAKKPEGSKATDPLEQLAVILIASRLQKKSLNAKQEHFITQYADAVTVSVSRQSGIIIANDTKLDLAPYHAQFQTTENDVKPGDVLELFHLAMFLATGKLGLDELMGRARYDMNAAEQKLQADLHDIRRSGTLKLARALSRFRGDREYIRPYAMRELVCGLAVKSMEVVPVTARSWVEMQVGSELGAVVRNEADDIDGRLLVDEPIRANGIVSRRNNVIVTYDEMRPTLQRRNYRYTTDRRGVIDIKEEVHDDEFNQKKRARVSVLDGIFG